jgi:hypothetical protein
MRRELGRRLLAWLATPEHAGHPDVPPEVAATAMSWMIFGSGLDWTQGPQTDPAQARATQLVRLLTSGLTTGLATGNQPLAATDERAPALLV